MDLAELHRQAIIKRFILDSIQDFKKLQIDIPFDLKLISKSAPDCWTKSVITDLSSLKYDVHITQIVWMFCKFVHPDKCSIGLELSYNHLKKRYIYEEE